MTNFEKVKEFMLACDQEVKKFPDFPEQETCALRVALIREELQELILAMWGADIVETADALTDLLYVVYGTGHAFGIDLDACFEEVHSSNLSKIGPTGKVIKSDNGKVLKPDTYVKPNLRRVLFDKN